RIEVPGRAGPLEMPVRVLVIEEGDEGVLRCLGVAERGVGGRYRDSRVPGPYGAIALGSVDEDDIAGLPDRRAVVPIRGRSERNAPFGVSNDVRLNGIGAGVPGFVQQLVVRIEVIRVSIGNRPLRVRGEGE